MSRGRWHFDAVSAALGAGVAITLFRIGGLLPPFLRSDAAAAWVQAVGSIAAIAAAIAIGRHQSTLMRNSFDQERELAREAIDQQRQMERVAREERRHSLRCAMASYGEKVLEPMAAVRDFMIAGDLGVVIDRAIHASEELAKARLRMQRIESHLHALSFDMIDAYNLLEDQIAEASKYVARARTMAEQGSIEPLAKYAPLVESTRTSIGTSLVGIVPEGPEKQHIEQTIANTGMKG